MQAQDKFPVGHNRCLRHRTVSTKVLSGRKAGAWAASGVMPVAEAAPASISDSSPILSFGVIRCQSLPRNGCSIAAHAETALLLLLPPLAAIYASISADGVATGAADVLCYL